MVCDHLEAHPSEWSAICSIADKVGMAPETLRKWVRRAEIEGGLRPGVTTDERERLKALERENRELQRANEILKSAALSSTGRLDMARPCGALRRPFCDASVTHDAYVTRLLRHETPRNAACRRTPRSPENCP